MLINKVKRVVNRTTLKNILSDPGQMLYSLKHQLSNGHILNAESLLKNDRVHVANFTAGNAGDTLLTIVLRDLFDKQLGCSNWSTSHVHDVVTKKKINTFNECDLTVLGGGGLFLQDTNPNSVSGWQWPITNAQIDQIQNLVVFAIGYNRFRGQAEFSDNFKESVERIIRKSRFFGVRNYGSLNALKSYVSEELHHKLSYQPCMTTVMSNIYGFKPVMNNEKIIGLNCAFDRAELRFGERLPKLMNDISEVVGLYDKDYIIHYMAHSPGDEVMCQYLDKANVNYKLIKLYNRSAEYVLSEFRKLTLMIGMRGHAQMIPFGCDVPIVSLISHEKLKWFLMDVNSEEWGVDVLESDFVDKFKAVINDVLENKEECINKIQIERNRLWDLTCHNIQNISQSVNAG